MILLSFGIFNKLLLTAVWLLFVQYHHTQRIELRLYLHPQQMQKCKRWIERNKTQPSPLSGDLIFFIAFFSCVYFFPFTPLYTDSPHHWCSSIFCLQVIIELLIKLSSWLFKLMPSSCHIPSTPPSSSSSSTSLSFSTTPQISTHLVFFSSHLATLCLSVLVFYSRHQ